jgi:hypothetical protein
MGFAEQMTPSEAQRFRRYWLRHAPEQTEPYSVYCRYIPHTGAIKQATTYDRFGCRFWQYDLIDTRHGDAHAHQFVYNALYLRPHGLRTDRLSLDEIDL